MSHNTWIHRVARATIVRPLMHTAVTPNQLTTLRLAAGVAASVLAALGADSLLNWSALLFLTGMLLDRADGDLARATGRSSAQGHRYDLISDAVCNAFIFVGLGIGLRSGELGNLAVALGLAAGAAVVYILWMVVRIETLAGERAGEISGAAGFDPDDAMLVVPIAIWLGFAQPLLFAAALGAPLFAVTFWWMFGRRKTARQL